MEEWLSGRKRLPAKQLYLLIRVPRVRIPTLPPYYKSKIKNIKSNWLATKFIVDLKN